MWRNYNLYLYALGILLISFVAYYPSLQADTVYWAGFKELSSVPTFTWLGVSLHLANILLIYIFLLVLSRNLVVAFAVSLIFGVHPLHADSVAWAMRQGDFIFSFLYLFLLLQHLLYLRSTSNWRWLYYGLAIVSFVIMLYLQAFTLILSAVAALFLLDYVEQKQINKIALIYKLPFLFLTIVSVFISFSGASLV
jgi:protein O-mannosyl-transferase